MAPSEGGPAQLGHGADTTKAPGHWVLARLGKRVLRPGGREMTRRMIDALRIGAGDDVVEFAPGLGATARMTIDLGPRSYTAVERDEAAAAAVRRFLAAPQQRCLVGRAEETGLLDGCASVVYGEAMLTMQSLSIKERIIAEAARLLRGGGRYGIHEVALTPDGLDESLRNEIVEKLTAAIHHQVVPLSVGGWRLLLGHVGFQITACETTPLHLLEPHRIIDDEGLFGAVRIAINALRDREARQRMLAMRSVFRTYDAHLCGVMIVGVKGRHEGSMTGPRP